MIGFAVDSAGRRSVSASVQVTIQAAGSDNTPPEIAQTVALRSEATDSIVIHATDPSGITRVGFVVQNLLGTVIGGDSLNFAGTNTDQRVTLGLKLATLAPLPAQVVVQAFAIDGAAAKNRGVTGAVFTVPSAPGSATARADTVTIVAGRTFPLPAGSQIGDAIFDKNTQQLYMTNTALSRVEVFQVANSTFVAGGIATAGPQPVGIALWPKDTLGGYADTIVVANSGGTELTVINVGRRWAAADPVAPGAPQLRDREVPDDQRRRLLRSPDHLLRHFRSAAVRGHGVSPRRRHGVRP